MTAKFLHYNVITFFKVQEETVDLLGKAKVAYFNPEHPPLTEPAQKAIDWAIAYFSPDQDWQWIASLLYKEENFLYQMDFVEGRATRGKLRFLVLVNPDQWEDLVLCLSAFFNARFGARSFLVSRPWSFENSRFSFMAEASRLD
ncbi:hypothetical protein Dimus_009813 [Dionaea muscipula]